MALYWDQCTVTIKNNTKSVLAFSNSNLADGFLSATPANIAAGASGSFTGSSNNADAANGCSGVVTYSLSDGTLVNVNYKTSYYYGINDNSTYTCGFQGPRAGLYVNTTSAVTTNESNGGAGKRVTWSLSVDYAP